MRLKKRRRNHVSGWRAVRRCLIFFTGVCVVPLVLVLLVATDHYMRPERHTAFISPQLSESGMRMVSDSLAMEHNMTLLKARLDSRREHLKKTCSLLGLDKPGNDSLHKPNSWEFLINDKYNLVWCNVFKAGSTSWMYNFNILAGYSKKFLKSTKRIPLTIARQKYPRPSVESLRKAFNKSTSFLIVRHPLERLLSAYRDKIQYALPHTYHKKLGSEIILKYRKPVTKPGPKYPTFPEFVDYLVDCVKKGEQLDMHWTPIVEFCTPCMFDFDIIAHTETLQMDQTYIIKKAKLEGIIQPEWKNPGKGSTSDQIAIYYSQLTRSQILQLYHIYRYDFELFNYSLQGYLELGIPDKDPSTLLAAITMKDFQNQKPQVY